MIAFKTIVALESENANPFSETEFESQNLIKVRKMSMTF